MRWWQKIQLSVRWCYREGNGIIIQLRMIFFFPKKYMIFLKKKKNWNWIRKLNYDLRANLCSTVMLSMRDCLTSWRSGGDNLPQWPVIFLRRRTAASWRTLGVLAVRRWWTSAGTTWGSLASRLIWSSACRRASLSGIRNWISRSSSDCAIPLTACMEIEREEEARVLNFRHFYLSFIYKEGATAAGVCFSFSASIVSETLGCDSMRQICWQWHTRALQVLFPFRYYY